MKREIEVLCPIVVISLGVVAREDFLQPCLRGRGERILFGAMRTLAKGDEKRGKHENAERQFKLLHVVSFGR